MVIRNKAVQEPVEVKTPTEAAGVKAIKPVTGTGRKAGSGGGRSLRVFSLALESVSGTPPDAEGDAATVLRSVPFCGPASLGLGRYVNFILRREYSLLVDENA